MGSETITTRAKSPKSNWATVITWASLCTERNAWKDVNHEKGESWIVLSVEDKAEYHGKPILAKKGKHSLFQGVEHR